MRRANRDHLEPLPIYLARAAVAVAGLRAILRADRREREAERVAEAELRRDEVASRRADARRRAAGDSHSETAEEVRSDGR